MATTTTRRPTCAWRGASGREYMFEVFRLPVDIPSGHDGNYIYAKVNAEGSWVPVYIGQGDLGERSGPGHHKAACIRAKGATHFHCHLNPDELKRLAEERDLLAYHWEAYEPLGCNEL